jgi:threonine/homoserine/homoserine lactone efflux protein
MLESVLNISLAALIAGFIFAMPIAGPISILIVSNVLNGKPRYSTLICLGASVADSIYVFIAVYGLTKFYSFYKPAIPFLLVIGSVFFIFLSRKIFNTKLDLENLKDESHVPKKISRRDRGGFYTGFMINLLNPTLFLSGLISAFFVISFVASLGLNTGGLNLHMDKNMKEISSIEGKELLNDETLAIEALKKFQDQNHITIKKEQDYPPPFHTVISLCYALFVSLGGLLWFQFLSWLLTRYRRKINLRFLGILIKAFGIILFLLGIYFGYLGIKQFV